jgi:hypothetical protein
MHQLHDIWLSHSLTPHILQVEWYRLREGAHQLLAIRRGLADVVPLEALSLLTWRELKLRVEGRATVDLALLRRNTVYRAGYTADSTLIGWFWRALESFSDVERQVTIILLLLLLFGTILIHTPISNIDVFAIRVGSIASTTGRKV